MSSTTVLGDLRPFDPVPEISIALPTTQRIIIVYLVQKKNNHRHAKTADLYPFHKNNQKRHRKSNIPVQIHKPYN